MEKKSTQHQLKLQAAHIVKTSECCYFYGGCYYNKYRSLFSSWVLYLLLTIFRGTNGKSVNPCKTLPVFYYCVWQCFALFTSKPLFEKLLLKLGDGGVLAVRL
jgi:hypothetical protein